MSNGVARHLDEVKDPVSKAKLEGIQQSSQAIDFEIINARKALDATHGMVAATDLIAKRLFQECGPIKKAVEDDRLDTDIAKIRIDTINANVAIVKGIQADAQSDTVKQRGIIDGLNRAQLATESKFNVEATKYERWERIQAEEAEAAKIDASSREAEQIGANAPGNAYGPQPTPKNKRGRKKTPSKQKAKQKAKQKVKQKVR